MSQTTERFQERIKAYLDDLASRDEYFALDYENPAKSIEECCDFIVQQVQKSGRCGFDDDEIFGLAVHYYQEQNLEEIKHIDCKVIVNEEVQLTPEEIEAAKLEAKERIVREEKARIEAEEKKAKEKAKQKAEEAKKQAEASGELSLFDMLENETEE